MRPPLRPPVLQHRNLRRHQPNARQIFRYNQIVQLNAIRKEHPLIELAPSILSADFSQLGDQAQSAIDAGGTVLHVDIMDGHFVPNITIGPPVVASLRKTVRNVPFDCHLMIENPDNFIEAFAQAGANWISVHQEACVHLNRTLHLISSHGCKPAVVINPATPVHTLDEVLDIVHHVLVMSVNPGFGGQHFIEGSLRKIESLARIRESRGLGYRIEVDGGIDLTTVADVVRAGADLLVAGNAVFGHGNIRDNVTKLLQAARATTLTRA
jgi:ribulose-phosphate 3-epimerase